jgi:hypothetical protein
MAEESLCAGFLLSDLAVSVAASERFAFVRGRRQRGSVHKGAKVRVRNRRFWTEVVVEAVSPTPEQWPTPDTLALALPYSPGLMALLNDADAVIECVPDKASLLQRNPGPMGTLEQWQAWQILLRELSAQCQGTEPHIELELAIADETVTEKAQASPCNSALPG